MLLLACAWTASGQTAPPEKDLIAIMELQPVGASEVEASALTDRLREELLRTGQFTMVDRSQMEAILEEQAFQQTGCTEQECVVQVGKILGVRKIVAGKLTKLSERLWQISTIMVDVETAETIRAESIQHKGDLFELLTTRVPELAQKLTRPAPTTAVTPPPAQPEFVREKPGWPLWTGWILLGLAAVFEVDALSSNDDAADKEEKAREKNDPERFSDAQSLRDEAESAEQTAILLGGAGASLLIYYYFFLESESAQSANAFGDPAGAPPPFRFRVGPNAVRAMWTLRW